MRLNSQNLDAGMQKAKQPGGKEMNSHLSRDRPGHHIYPRLTPKQLADAVQKIPEGMMMEVHFHD